MGKFEKKKSSRGGAISTAALPDIVFMLLFFFMVSTVMRENVLEVSNTLPKAEMVTKIKKKTLVDYLYIGYPRDKVKYGTEPLIQLNGVISGLEDIEAWVLANRDTRREEERESLTTVIKADEKVTNGIVTDVKEGLRDVQALRIKYATAKKTIKK